MNANLPSSTLVSPSHRSCSPLLLMAALLIGPAPAVWCEPSPEAQQCYEAGVELKAAKKYWEAVAELEQAVRLAPDWADAYWVAAWAYSHLNQNERAVALFQHLLWLEPQGDRAVMAMQAIWRKTGGPFRYMSSPAVLSSQPAPAQPAAPRQPRLAFDDQAQAPAAKAPDTSFARPKGLPPLGETLFSDDFTAGQDKWQTIGGTVAIEDGALCIKGGKEGSPFPVAMIKQQFQEQRIAVEFRAESVGDPLGDVGINLGGYIVSLGGWNNGRTVLFKLVGGQMKELASQNVGVRAGKTYHCLFVRDGAKLAYFVDGKLLLQAEDPEPLTGDETSRVNALTYFERHVHFKNVLVHKLP